MTEAVAGFIRYQQGGEFRQKDVAELMKAQLVPDIGDYFRRYQFLPDAQPGIRVQRVSAGAG